MDTLIKLGFDRYQRFRAAQELIEQLADGRRLTILEAGVFDQAFTPFLTGHDHRCWPEQIRPGHGVNLPDRSVDLSMALDVLEHVRPEERAFFISELVRLADKAVLLSFPIKKAQEAEKFVLELTGSAWLAEHQRLGLPDHEEIEKLFDGLGLEFVRHPNGSLPSWTAMMLLMYGLERTIRDQVCAFFNQNYYALENREPAYRYIYVLSRPDHS